MTEKEFTEYCLFNIKEFGYKEIKPFYGDGIYIAPKYDPEKNLKKAQDEFEEWGKYKNLISSLKCNNQLTLEDYLLIKKYVLHPDTTNSFPSYSYCGPTGLNTSEFVLQIAEREYESQKKRAAKIKEYEDFVEYLNIKIRSF